MWFSCDILTFYWDVCGSVVDNTMASATLWNISSVTTLVSLSRFQIHITFANDFATNVIDQWLEGSSLTSPRLARGSHFQARGILWHMSSLNTHIYLILFLLGLNFFWIHLCKLGYVLRFIWEATRLGLWPIIKGQPRACYLNPGCVERKLY